MCICKSDNLINISGTIFAEYQKTKNIINYFLLIFEFCKKIFILNNEYYW